MKFYITSQSNSEPFKVPNEGPWLSFFEKFVDSGHSIVSLQENPDVIVFMNNHPRLLKKIKRENWGVKKVLVMWEPKIARSSNFGKYIHEFDYVFSPSPLWISGKKVSYFSWPQGPKVSGNSPLVDWKLREDKVLLFQSNKFSFAKGELYSLRREVLQKCHDSLILYGKNWNNRRQTVVELVKSLLRQLSWGKLNDFSLPKKVFINSHNYGGYVNDKMELLGKTKYSLVIENSANYVSEKLFEAAVTGNVSIYVGPPLELFGIPKIAIQAQPNVESICKAIRTIRENDLEVHKIRENLEVFLSSKQYLEMQNDRVLANLAASVIEKVKEDEISVS